ncbi:MAG: 16S rRNA (cytidine(1402)-2'-O)-methyltransferase [Tenericutes bacterium HGW-Tenericutes-3]|nr:MAG: 16S rRNA (cytidine(1402)-2'-O)-methyltransferase [Tenericutes bacterium HGW-Tenericutes-3]
MQKSFKDPKPTLYVVATPIGNLKDISYRAVEILNEVDVILAEDTRTSSVLLNHYQIKKQMMSYHEFNKDDKESQIINLLSEGKNLALISDAGTPGINDPGYEIIKKVIESGYYVVSIPGASALLAAIVTSGLIIQPFTFLGFLPRKQVEMKKILTSYIHRKETLVIYESPLRVSKTIQTIYQILGERNVSLARELTKAFETIIRTTLSQAILMEHNPKGEYVIIIEGDTQKQTDFNETIVDHVSRLVKQGETEKDAMKIVALERSIPKSEVYQAYKIDNKKT